MASALHPFISQSLLLVLNVWIDVTASHFNKRQKAIRSQHRLCAGPVPVKLTFVRNDSRRHVETHQSGFQLCNVTAVMLACMLMLISPAWQGLTSPSSMAWRVRAPRETQGPNVSGRWADPWAVLTPANGWPVSREKPKCLASWRTVSLACSLYLDSCIYLHRGTEYIRSEKRWRS